MYHNQFATQKALKIIGSKWTIFLLRELCEGTKRFGEIEKNLPGISSKTLSVRLKELEKQGIVKKKIYPMVPLKVEYSLTPKGSALKQIILAMHQWSEQYL